MLAQTESFGLGSEPPMTEVSTEGSLKVLIVDDNHDAGDMLAELLSMSGCEVRVARTGQEALQAAEQMVPGLALLDVGLPDLSGYEVARRMREIPSCRAARLVALTGFGRSEDKERAREAGFDAHRVKPVSFDDLLAELKASRS